jgi:hypothetical protein
LAPGVERRVAILAHSDRRRMGRGDIALGPRPVTTRQEVIRPKLNNGV